MLIAAAFAFGGRFLASLDSERVACIREILLMINIIETRLRFSATPVVELLTLIEDSGSCNRLGFVKKCRLAVENGDSFNGAWRKSIEECRAFCKLLPEESKKLIAMGGDIGVTDIEGQLSCCGYYKKLFDNSLVEKEDKSKHSSKLFPPLGVLLGISAAIFLV